MKQSRRNHSSKLKARIALEALRGDATLSELSSRHGVHANQIGTWRKQLLERAGYAANALPGVVVGLSLVFLGARYLPGLYQTFPLLLVAFAVTTQ